MPDLRSKYELRCFCKRSTLLAMYGRTGNGGLYIHVKTYRQRQVISEVVVTSGTVELFCRDCFRWQRVVIRSDGEATLREQARPKFLEDNNPSNRCLPVSGRAN